MNLLHRWTIRRIEKAALRVLKRIPKQDCKRIISLLGRIYYSTYIPEYCSASTGVLQNDKYVVTFFLPHLWYKSSESLLVTVAHEFAHVLLGHCYVEVPRLVTEEQVHNQLEAWGFKDDDYELVSQYLKEHPEI